MGLAQYRTLPYELARYQWEQAPLLPYLVDPVDIIEQRGCIGGHSVCVSDYSTPWRTLDINYDLLTYNMHLLGEDVWDYYEYRRSYMRDNYKGSCQQYVITGDYLKQKKAEEPEKIKAIRKRIK